jgi:AraC-like DNA-binding protein
MDVLSDTLRVVRLTGAVFLNATITAPWSFVTASSAALAAYMRLPSDCIALFHIVVRGHGWFTVPGYAPILLHAGDAILLPHNPPHGLSSGHGTSPVPLLSVLPPLPPERFFEVGRSRNGEVSQLVCGYLHSDQRFNPLLGALPELMVVHPRDTDPEAEPAPLTAQAPPAVLEIQSGDWLHTTLRHTVEEAMGNDPGKSEMMARLSEILFVEIVRRYMRQLPPTQYGWLAAVRDPLVGQTLRLLHAHPEQAWTVEALADAVAVARSTLAQRFTTFVGETPMRYLAVWRMQMAKYLLKQTSLSVGEIAQHVGYESDVAFNHAFKRNVGQPPATWRATFDSPADQPEPSSTLIS